MEEKRTALEIERLNAQMEAKILEQENKEMTEKEKAQACLLRKDAAGESLHSAQMFHLLPPLSTLTLSYSLHLPAGAKHHLQMMNMAKALKEQYQQSLIVSRTQAAQAEEAEAMSNAFKVQQLGVTQLANAQKGMTFEKVDALMEKQQEQAERLEETKQAMAALGRGVAPKVDEGELDQQMAALAAEAGVPLPSSSQPAASMGMMQPGMGMMQPGMGMMQPGMMQPGMMQPGMMQPGMGMMQPGMMQPGMMQPGMMQPGMMTPQQQCVSPPYTVLSCIPPPMLTPSSFNIHLLNRFQMMQQMQQMQLMMQQQGMLQQPMAAGGGWGGGGGGAVPNMTPAALPPQHPVAAQAAPAGRVLEHAIPSGGPAQSGSRPSSGNKAAHSSVGGI
jgi:hypothetical protein